MNRALRACKRPGCINLTGDISGFCSGHEQGRFDNLSAAKEDWKRHFYSAQKWRKKSLDFRKRHPFCEGCWPKRVKATLVHHDPSLIEIVDKLLDPYDDKYLHSSCLSCHQAELQKKGVDRGIFRKVCNVDVYCLPLPAIDKSGYSRR